MNPKKVELKVVPTEPEELIIEYVEIAKLEIARLKKQAKSSQGLDRDQSMQLNELTKTLLAVMKDRRFNKISKDIDDLQGKNLDQLALEVMQMYQVDILMDEKKGERGNKK